MKALHKLINPRFKDSRPILTYAQVKSGFVYLTDTHAAVKFPISEVFGEGVVSENEEFLIPCDQWKQAKMDKAVYIDRTGLVFEALDGKRQHLGSVKAIDCLTDADGNEVIFPPVEVVLPTSSTEVSVGVNAEELKKLAGTLGANALELQITRLNSSRPIRVKAVVDHMDETRAIGVIMPLAGRIPTYFSDADPGQSDTGRRIAELERKVLDLQDDLDEAKSDVEKLEGEKETLENKKAELEENSENKVDLDDFTQVHTGNGHKLLYKTENPVDEMIMEAFAECLAAVPPTDMLENLRLIQQYKTVI